MNQKRKLLLIGVIVLFLGLLFAWKISGSSVTGLVRNFILQTASNAVNGTLSVGDVDFSLSGHLVAKQVELKDKSGGLIASAQTLSIDFDLMDLLSRRFDVERVRKISVEGLVLNLIRDKNERWNAKEALRKTQEKPSAPSAIFRGKVVATNAAVTVATPDSHYSFKKVDGTLDFAKYPEITMDLTSKEGASNLSAKGSWNFDGGGKIAISAEAVDPTVFAPTAPLKGATSATAELSGTTDKPTASGSFKIPAGTLGDQSFTHAAGEFSFADNALSLVNVKANSLGGSITANGPLYIDSLRYVQKLSGQNLDSAQLSEKDINGRLSFSADVRGQESWAGANADGTFSMGPGSVSGISFDALTGNFSKRGSSTRYYNLRATIAGQTIYIGDADSLGSVKALFKAPGLTGLPNLPIPAVPKAPVAPALPKSPKLPRLF